MSQAKSATAIAHPNVALAKYWGKREVAGNVPATPSVSVALGGLATRTTVTFTGQDRDELVLGGKVVTDEPLARVTRLLDEVRALSKVTTGARVVSDNDFPTASGLASSASGFAALVRAAAGALDLSMDDATASRIARRASASAARSIYGGFVALGTEDDAAALPVAAADHFPLTIVVAAVTLAAKDVSSTSGMDHCRATSPFYRAWVDDAPKLAGEVREAILARDLERLGVAAEASALRMHACMLASAPALVYWAPATLELLARVRGLRREGIGAWATIDAGPHVKVLCAPGDAKTISERLASAAERIIVARVGGPTRLVSADTPEDP